MGSSRVVGMIKRDVGVRVSPLRVTLRERWSPPATTLAVFALYAAEIARPRAIPSCLPDPVGSAADFK